MYRDKSIHLRQHRALVGVLLLSGIAFYSVKIYVGLHNVFRYFLSTLGV